MMGAAVLITDIVAVPVGSWLLSKALWLPYWFSTPIILLVFPIIIAIPETVPKNKDNPICLANTMVKCQPINQSR